MRYEGIVYRPPSEAYSYILQVTIGCAHNRCTFCTMYKDKRFRIRTMEEIREDIRMAKNAYHNRVRRIFLADGDALVLRTEMLLEILALLKEAFPGAERITSYGAPKDVLHKTPEELKLLQKAGLDMVYMGAESGDDTVLAQIHKGVSADEIAQAGVKLQAAGIRTSITLISGIGGRARKEEHALASAELISRIVPDYLGFLTLMREPGAKIEEEIRSGRMEVLTPEDVVDEMEIFLSHVDAPGTVFRSNHASNYLMLKGTLNRDIPAMLRQIEEAKRRSAYRPEELRGL